MKNFPDNLITRHLDVEPQIKPRLPSVFEPETQHGGLGVIALGNNAPEIEETLFNPSVRAEEGAPTHREAIADPVSLTVTEGQQPKAVRVTETLQQGHAPETIVDEKPKHSVLKKEVGQVSKNFPVPIFPAKFEKETASGHPIQSASSKEQAGREARRERPQARAAFPLPDLQATPEEHTSVQEHLIIAKPAVSLFQRAEVKEANAMSDPFTLPLSRRKQEYERGFLQPSATLIAPVLPAAGGPEKPVSQPEPVINVTIGRIEVRATVSPQKQSPKPEKRPPVMGLEEYLRQRSKGHDR